MEFKSLKTLATYIQHEYLETNTDYETHDTLFIDTYIWNNDAGDWDIDDILINYEVYDKVYTSYYLDIRTFNIYGYTKPDERVLIFRNIQN